MATSSAVGFEWRAFDWAYWSLLIGKSLVAVALLHFVNYLDIKIMTKNEVLLAGTTVDPISLFLQN